MSSSIPPLPPRSLRILYAEENNDLRQVMSAVFEYEGHTVTAVPHGLKALKELRQSTTAYDLIVTDHWLTRVRGLDLVAAARELGYRGRFAIITSGWSPALSEAYGRARVDFFHVKPITFFEIQQMLRHIVSLGPVTELKPSPTEQVISQPHLLELLIGATRHPRHTV